MRFVSIEEVGGRAVIKELVSMFRLNCLGVIVNAFKDDVLIKLVNTFVSGSN